jgi:hypothetical protein
MRFLSPLGPMCTVTEFKNHARACRELAMVRKLEDKYALDRAAQSWDNLAELRQRELAAAENSSY